jgi:hypothetical protein
VTQQHVTNLLLAALIAGTLHTGQASALGIWRGVCPLVVVEVVIMIVVMFEVEETGRAAINGAPFALRRAAAIETLAPHTSGKLGALHGRAGAPRGWGEIKTDGVSTEARVGSPIPETARDGVSWACWAAAVRSVEGPVSRLRCERIGGEKADLRKGVVVQASLVPPPERGWFERAGGALRAQNLTAGVRLQLPIGLEIRRIHSMDSDMTPRVAFEWIPSWLPSLPLCFLSRSIATHSPVNNYFML